MTWVNSHQRFDYWNNVLLIKLIWQIYYVVIKEKLNWVDTIYISKLENVTVKIGSMPHELLSLLK